MPDSTSTWPSRSPPVRTATRSISPSCTRQTKLVSPSRMTAPTAMRTAGRGAAACAPLAGAVFEEAHLHAHVRQDARLERSKPMRTRTVAFWRSAVGTMLITWLGMIQSGYASSTASVFWFGLDAIDERLVDVDLDLARVHVDDGRDAGAREAAAGGDRRHHLAGLRILRDDDAVERRAHHQIVEILRAHAHGAFGDLHFAAQRFESRVERRGFRLRLVELQFAHQLVFAQLLGASQVALRFGDADFDFVEILARGIELALRERVHRAWSSCRRGARAAGLP